MTDKPPNVRLVVEAIEVAIDGATGKRRERKPRIDNMIAQAERAGKSVASITTPEGYTVTFGQPRGDDAPPKVSNGNGRNLEEGKNEWDAI